MAKSDFLETVILNHVLRNTSYASPATVYLALYTVAEDDTGGAGTEVSGGSYARQLISFAAPIANQVANSADILFPVASADWGTVVHFGIRDAASGGNLLYHAPLTASRTILTGDQLRFPAGQLVVGED
jgi:hypothetical protein